VEDDTLRVSPRRRLAGSWRWLRVATVLLGSSFAVAIGPGAVSAAEPAALLPLAALSPLRPLMAGAAVGTAQPAASGGGAAAAPGQPAAQASGATANALPPLPLFAQATPAPPTASKPTEKDLKDLKDIEPPPFATPAPGQVVDDDDDSDEAEKKKKALRQKKIECDNDAQCPAQTICVKSACRSTQRSISALIYYHQKGPIGYRVVAPFYYSFWRPQKQTRVLAPLFVDHKNNEAKTRDTWVFPTYQYRREPGLRAHRLWPLVFYANYDDSDNKGKAFGIMPLFWASKRQKSSLVVLPPLLFFHHHDEAKQTSHTLFLPLLTYVGKQKQETLALFLGLGYYRRSADKVWGGLFPLVWHQRSAEHRSTLILPIFYEGENKITHDRFVTLLPLFFYRRSGEKGQARLLVTPLGGSYKNRETGESTTLTLLPLLLHRDDPVRRYTAVPPLAMWWRNKETGRSWGYVGPFFYTRDDEGSSQGLLPLYLHFASRQARASTTVVVPLLAALHRSPQLKFGFLGPLFGWSRPAEGASGGGLIPLLSYARGPRPHFAFLPPVLIYAADRQAGTHHLSIGPVFYRWQTKGPQAGYDAGVFPLLWVSRHGASSRQMLLPLFYHHRMPGNERLVIGPVYWDRRCPTFIGDTRAAVTGGVAPILYWKRSPLQSYTIVFPLIWHVRTPNRTALVVGPVFWSRQSLKSEQGAPAGERTTFGLFPLFFATRSPQSSLVVGPLFGYRRTAERRTLAIGPFFETVYAPGRREQSITRAVLPLFYFHCSPGRRATVLFPLFMQIQEEKTTFRSVALLYYGLQKPQSSTHVIFPLLWFVRGPRTSTTVVGPFFYHHDRDKTTMAVGLLPLFGFGRTRDSVTLGTPLGFYTHNYLTGRTRSAFLLFYANSSPERSDYGFFPLVFATRRGTASAVFVTPFFYHSQDPAKERSFTLLGPLYWGHKGKATYGGVAPLFYGRSEGDGSYKFMALPLLYASHRAGPQPQNWLLTPLFGFGTSSTGFRAYIGPGLLYFRRDAEVHSAALWPLFYYSHDLKTRTTIGMALPLYFRIARPESSLTMVTPLFWHYGTLTKRVSLLFPFVLDVKDLYASRLTAAGVVIPFVVRSRDYVNNTTTWVFPPLLTYVKHKASGYYDVITFPLFFHFGGKERSTTVLFPLFYNLKRPATQFTMLLPLFAYHRDEHDTKTLLLPPLLTWARNYADGSRDRVVFPLFWHFKRPAQSTTVFAPFGAYWSNAKGRHTLVLNTYVYKGAGESLGAWRFEFWPLFHVGRPRKQDLQWDLLAGLVGYSREGRNRTLRLLWAIFIPLEPVGAKTAWYGATWRMASDE